MNKVNAYEYSGIVCPGALFLWLADCIVHYGLERIVSTAGGFGFFLILAFCIGNLLQGIANFLENCFWKPEKYTEKRLQEEKINETPRAIYILIRKNKGNTDRVDVFNKQYGLMRGMFVCFLLVTVLFIILLLAFSLLDLPDLLVFTFLSLLCCFFSGYRAFHFAKIYTEELIHEYKVSVEKNAE